MTSTYPKSTTWPYVAVVVSLLCTMLVPQNWWSQQKSRILDFPSVRAVQLCYQLHQQTRLAKAKKNRGAAPLAQQHSRLAEPSQKPHPVATCSDPTVGKKAPTHRTMTVKLPASWSAAPIQPLVVEPSPPVSNRVSPRGPNRASPLTRVPGVPPAGNAKMRSFGSESINVDKDAIGRLPIERQSNHSTQLAAQPQERPLDRTESPLWPRSAQLHSLLDQSQNDPFLSSWARAIRAELESLEQQPMEAIVKQLDALARLREAAAGPQAVSDLPYESQRRAATLSYAVFRRIDLWQALLTLDLSHPPIKRFQRAVEESQRVLSSLLEQLSTGEYAQSWSNFLGLSEMQVVLDETPADMPSIANCAEELLQRIHATGLTSNQAAFLATPHVLDWDQALRRIVAENVATDDLIRDIEAFESQPHHAERAVVMNQLRRWNTSPDAEKYRPAVQAITTHYRNANLRLAVSEEMLNRLLPAMQDYSERVSDTILGAEVRGRNSTSTALSVAVVPDPRKIRLRLQVRGKVTSNTTSRKGPVTVFSRGNSTFTADKELIVQTDGIYVMRTQANATSGTSLIGLRSDLDDVPILGWMIRTIARQQHDDQRPLLRAEIVRRIKRMASQKMDRAVQERLAHAEQRIQQRLLQPLRHMHLDPVFVEMRTTPDRIIMRSRLASPLQFGAHTPRPQARQDSLLSLQIHQTAANNLIEQLQLHGKRMTLDELVNSLSQRLGIDGLAIRAEERKEVTVQFASQHPLDVEFENGKITLTVHFAELDNGRRKWRNFSVRGYYSADIDQLDVELIRDGGIELISERLGLRDQIALRSIFTKVLAKNHRLRILGQTLARQPNLQHLEVTQLVIRDGWLGLSLGEDPKVVEMAGRAATAVPRH